MGKLQFILTVTIIFTSNSLYAKSITCEQDDQETISIGPNGVQMYLIDENYNTEESPSVVIKRDFNCTFGDGDDAALFNCTDGKDYVYSVRKTSSKLRKNGQIYKRQNLELHTNLEKIRESVAWPNEEFKNGIVIEDYYLITDTSKPNNGAALCKVE